MCLSAAIAACGGAKTAPKDATPPAPVVDAKAIDAAAPKKPATGDARVRVEWTNVPVAARSSPGKTPCGTPRAPSVRPTTTWGVPDAIVVLDGEPPTGEARVELGACALSPIAALGATLVVASANAAPSTVAVARAPAIDQPAGADRQTVMLPIAGHAVTLALDANAAAAVYAGDEVAWVVGARGEITDASGVALLRDLSPGSHAVTAWLPPRAGMAARIAHGKVVIAIGEVADVTLTL